MESAVKPMTHKGIKLIFLIMHKHDERSAGIAFVGFLNFINKLKIGAVYFFGVVLSALVVLLLFT